MFYITTITRRDGRPQQFTASTPSEAFTTISGSARTTPGGVLAAYLYDSKKDKVTTFGADHALIKPEHTMRVTAK